MDNGRVLSQVVGQRIVESLWVLLTGLSVLVGIKATAQTTAVLPAVNLDTAKNIDTSATPLAPVTITAFQGRGDGQDIAAAISTLDQRKLQLLDKSSLLSAFNSVPGLRLEERSPGSLRFSIRGSLLRSPYGVRGVKFYLDGIPLTDAGGNTYLQSIAPEWLQSAEIIKGPAASLYGAGTGGAVLLHSPAPQYSDDVNNRFGLSYETGSYGRIHPVFSWTRTGPGSFSAINASHLHSDGHRDQDTLSRTSVNFKGSYQLSKDLRLRLSSFYTDLNYQTPGGVTLHQWHSDTSAYPLAVRQKTAIFNKTFWGGASLTYQITPGLENTTSLLLSHTNFKNPFTSNYEKRKEWNYGGRTQFSLRGVPLTENLSGQLVTGLEWVAGSAQIDNYGNRQGHPDTVQYKDRLQLQRKSFFLQYQLQFAKRLFIQTGISANQQVLRYHRLGDATPPAKSSTQYQWSPKFGVNYQAMPSVTIFATAAKGFSTPTLAEVHPSDGRFEKDLEAENGWNLEVGLRGEFINKRLSLSGSIYRFSLKNAIVRRVDANNTEYFVNAGSTRQQGIELSAGYRLLPELPENTRRLVRQISVSGSYGYQPYRFIHYQVENDIYDGHPLTGVPKNVAVFSVNLQLSQGIYLHSLLNATSSISLNDASTVVQPAYQLFQAKIGYRFKVRQIDLDLYVGIDNMLNQRYSLGNDINAYGNRYYNPAPGRNFYTGLAVGF